MLYIILLAAGSSERFGEDNKLLADLGDKPVFLHSLENFLNLEMGKEVVLVVDEIKSSIWNKEYGDFFRTNSVNLVSGGKTRQESVFNAWEYIRTESFGKEKDSGQGLNDLVLVHNAANPLVTDDEITRVLKAAKLSGAAAVAHEVSDTIRRFEDGETEVLDRSNLYLMQTPQVVRVDIFANAYQLAKESGFEGTDEIALVENWSNQSHSEGTIESFYRQGEDSCLRRNDNVQIVAASKQNFKITYPEDLEIARRILCHSEIDTSTIFHSSQRHPFGAQDDKKGEGLDSGRGQNDCFEVLGSGKCGDNISIVGIGEDSHRFINTELGMKSGECLVLGGLSLKDYPAMNANSDGDVMLHALANALSSALGGKSLGSWADKMCLEGGVTDSREFLKPLFNQMKEKNLQITSVSFSLECSKPKIDNISDSLKISLSDVLNLRIDQIGITATSGEELTAFGRGEGVRCTCVVLLKRQLANLEHNS